MLQCNVVKINEIICELQVCRGIEGPCSFTLVDGPQLRRKIKQSVKFLSVSEANQISKADCSPHKRLRFALAACPNACTQPQIKDIGIIARLFPSEVNIDCKGCRECVSVCRKQAITMRNGKAEILAEKCLGCGMCVNQCPYKMIKSQELVFQVLIGGRMGRHPKWAQDLCHVENDKLCDVIKYLLDEVVAKLFSGELISELIERLGGHECFVRSFKTIVEKM